MYSGFGVGGSDGGGSDGGGVVDSFALLSLPHLVLLTILLMFV